MNFFNQSKMFSTEEVNIFAKNKEARLKMLNQFSNAEKNSYLLIMLILFFGSALSWVGVFYFMAVFVPLYALLRDVPSPELNLQILNYFKINEPIDEERFQSWLNLRKNRFNIVFYYLVFCSTITLIYFFLSSKWAEIF
jgi:hypothetical protein